jgi:hypothetical protein
MSRWARPASPQIANDRETLVDDRVVHGRLVDLGGAVEELGDHQVLPLRGELHHAVGLGAGQAGALHQRQRVVLLLHEPPHGVERLLVLEPAVQQGAAELVGAVGAQVAPGIQLGEQPPVPVALDLDAQGVEPAEPSNPNGWTSSTMTPSWSWRPRRIASPRRPPTSR